MRELVGMLRDRKLWLCLGILIGTGVPLLLAMDRAGIDREFATIPLCLWGWFLGSKAGRL